MGIFDSLKDVALKNASDMLEQAKDEATDKMSQEVRERGREAVVGGVKNYLDDAYEKVPNPEGKEAVESLRNLVDDSENLRNSVISSDSDEQEHYEQKTQEDLQKLSNIVDEYNKNNN